MSYQQNAATVLAQKKEYYSANKARIAAYKVAWRARERKAIAARKRRWYAENGDECRARQRAYYLANRVRIDPIIKRWMAANPDAVRNYKARSRARRRGAAGRCTREQIAARIELFGGVCWLCGCEADTIDHVIPIAAGGAHWPANLRPACKSCNSRKRDKRVHSKPVQLAGYWKASKRVYAVRLTKRA